MSDMNEQLREVLEEQAKERRDLANLDAKMAPLEEEMSQRMGRLSALERRRRELVAQGAQEGGA